MTLVVPFIHYSGTSKETSRRLFEFQVSYLKAMQPHVKEVLIIDSGDFIDDYHGFSFVKKPHQGHWDNLEEVLPTIDDDSFLLIDSDTILYDQYEVESHIWDVYENRVSLVSATDGSGQMSHELLTENAILPGSKRFTPYFMACRTSVMVTYLQNGGRLCPGEYTDSFGDFSIWYAEKHRFFDVQDDRTTVLWTDSGIKVENWSVQPGHEFSTMRKTGWYHIRNIGAGLRMAETMQEDTAMPTFELVRLCWWAQRITGKDMTPVVLSRISQEDWTEYQETASEVHAY